LRGAVRVLVVAAESQVTRTKLGVSIATRGVAAESQVTRAQLGADGGRGVGLAKSGQADQVPDHGARAGDRADRQFQNPVSAAHQRDEARPCAQVGMCRRPSASGRPTKMASIGKRMNIMWIPFESGSHRPDPSGSDARPIRPMNLAQSEDATSSDVTRSVARVTLRAVVGRSVIEVPVSAPEASSSDVSRCQCHRPSRHRGRHRGVSVIARPSARSPDHPRDRPDRHLPSGAATGR